MRPVVVQTLISAPREEIFDLIVDLSRRVAWTDHYARDLRLARANPVGAGAAARFVVKPPMQPRAWVELSIAEVDRPRRVVEHGRVGRVGRSRLLAEYELIRESPHATRVVLTTLTEPGTRWDAVKDGLARGWLRRQTRVALARLRAIFEDPPGGALASVGIAGFERSKQARFGA